MPAFNSANTILTSVHSVLAQTYSNLELIIVDDGSTDDTKLLVLSLADSRVRYHYQDNPGTGSAGSPRNLGLKHAAGEYIAFLDSDDIWMVNFLSTHIHIFMSLDSSVGLTFSGYHTFTSTPDLSASYAYRNPRLFRNNYYDLLITNFIPMPTVVIRASVLLTVGYFRTDLRGLEDWDLWLRVSQKYHIHRINQDLAYYRLSTNSMSADKYSYTLLEEHYLSTYFKLNPTLPASVRLISLTHSSIKLLKNGISQLPLARTITLMLQTLFYSLRSFPLSLLLLYSLIQLEIKKCISHRS